MSKKLKKRIKKLERQIDLLTNVILVSHGYEWEPLSTNPDNGGMILESLGNGSWVRIDSKEQTPRWFGAKGE